jgi:hypothetical protein
MARALAPRALAVVVVLGHLEQGGWTSFKVIGEEERCRSNSLKIEMAG